MEQRSVESLRGIAEVHLVPPPPPDHAQRLELWAKALEHRGLEPVRLFHQLEFMPRSEWESLRVEDSPLTIAFNDPSLRAAGLQSDRLGDAMAFFNLGERDTHRMLCSCVHGAAMSASRAAGIVRQVADPAPQLAVRAATFAIGVSALVMFLYFA
jgi:hypothetical protein